MKEQAEKILTEFLECKPSMFLEKIENMQKGGISILFYLEQSETEVIAGDIAKEMQVSTARIAVLLRKLENSDLIEKCNSTSDARKTVVKITNKGREYCQEIKNQILYKTEHLIEEFGMEKLENFLQMTKDIKQALDE